MPEFQPNDIRSMSSRRNSRILINRLSTDIPLRRSYGSVTSAIGLLITPKSIKSKLIDDFKIDPLRNGLIGLRVFDDDLERIIAGRNRLVEPQISEVVDRVS